MKALSGYRVGFGYDVHRLVANRRLVLGGVEIPFAKGLLGHSDADVLSHAICDAILGAAALGDIGRHFPDTDPRFEGISSLNLLGRVAELVAAHRYEIVNVDSTLVLQQPKIAPLVGKMIENISTSLGIHSDQVSVKATTSEELGFVGRGEGVAAHAVASIRDRQVTGNF